MEKTIFKKKNPPAAGKNKESCGRPRSDSQRTNRSQTNRGRRRARHRPRREKPLDGRRRNLATRSQALRSETPAESRGILPRMPGVHELWLVANPRDQAL